MGRSVLVTGGSRGIGLAVAKAFAENGDDVAITYNGSAPPEGFLAVKCDVTEPVMVESAFAEIEQKQGPVEILIANAGITRDTLLLRMSEEDWSSVIETNLTGAFRVVKRASKGMLRQRKGRIVFVSSVNGMRGAPGQVNYAASKTGMIGMARSIARELGSRGITANVVTPGFVETDITGELSEDMKKEYIAATPLGRTTTGDEVARVIRWLASDEAAYITGAVIPIDGGFGMGY
ncbi:Rossmann-fold NAD(P)-binding domain-containing protein [Flindersiella endophytica]